MTRISRDQLAFSSGEISPLLRARIDYQRFLTGLAACPGWLPLRQGGITRGPGTIFRGYTRDNAKARLIAFEFAKNDSLVLEFTAGWMRVWRYGALVTTSGGAVYEMAHPYSETDLDILQWVQSADVIYIAGGGLPIQRLARLALDNWTIGDAPLRNGPFRVQNLTKSRTIQADGTTGTVQLTASQSLFKAGHVGSLMRLEVKDYADIPIWTGNTDASVGQKMRYDGRIYELTAGTNTGINPPLHEEGVEQVSLDPLAKWRYLGDGVGLVRVTAVGSGTSATATVLRRLPDAIVETPSYRWSEGAWSDVHGYPSSLEIHDQRLVAAATPSEPRTIWFSVVGDFEDFDPGTDADSAFSYSIAGGTSQNRILWLKAGRRGLHIGALGEEYSARAADGGEALNATNVKFGFDSSIGSLEGGRPIAPDGSPVFISKDGKRVVELAYSFQNDANRATELSLPSEHLGKPGFSEIVWQSAPMRLAWLRRGDGSLAAMVYDPTEEVLGWAPSPVAGGRVEALAVASDITGTRDLLAMVTARQIDGATVRMVEEQADNFDLLSGASPIHEAVHLFAARVFSEPGGASSFAVSHLVGQDVYVWTDIGEFGPITVPPGGTVTTPIAVTSAVIGLAEADCKPETLPLQPMANDGSARGRRKRLGPQTAITVHQTAALKIAVVEYDLGQAEREWMPVNLLPRAVAADLNQAFSGTVRAPVASGWAQDLAIRLYPVGGAPATVLAMTPHLQEGGL
ncbi:MAG: hypothetical protein ACU0FT_04215 [Paracoccus sp. (in: a-proteobacteria)]|uniref:hypothetical protein n=1 Tax=Paracoccus sp. TaxID=267 RepID=UPI00405A1B80